MSGRTAAELENSAPFDPDRRLRGDAGRALREELRTRIEAWEQATGARQRARKLKDSKSLALTLDTFLANLVALRLNRVDPTRFLAVSFDKAGRVSGSVLLPLRNKDHGPLGNLYWWLGHEWRRRFS